MNWVRNLLSRGNNDQATESATSTETCESVATTLEEGQQVWATNAPGHWPSAIAPATLNSMGLNSDVTADPFQKAAFAAAIVEAFNAEASACRLGGFSPDRFGVEVDFEFVDHGNAVPAMLYPTGGTTASRHFQEVSRQLAEAGQPAPVYFAPEPLELDEQPVAESPTIVVAVENLLPRMVANDFLLRFPPEAELVSRPIIDSRLLEVLVLDSSESVAFVTTSMLDDLQLSEDEAFRVAEENLKPRLPENVVRGVMEHNQMPMLQTFDGFDAARVLVLPSRLKAGETVAAMVPDRDSCVLLAVPPEKDTPEFWAGLADFPGCDASSPAITSRPLRVTRSGITME